MFDYPPIPTPDNSNNQKKTKFLSQDDIPEEVKKDMADRGYDINDPNVKIFSIAKGDDMEEFKKEIKAAIEEVVDQSKGGLDSVPLSTPNSNINSEVEEVKLLVKEVIEKLRPKISKSFNQEFEYSRGVIQAVLQQIREDSDIQPMLDAALLAGACLVIATSNKAMPPPEVLSSISEASNVNHTLFSAMFNLMFTREIHVLLSGKLLSNIHEMRKTLPGTDASGLKF